MRNDHLDPGATIPPARHRPVLTRRQPVQPFAAGMLASAVISDIFPIVAYR